MPIPEHNVPAAGETKISSTNLVCAQLRAVEDRLSHSGCAESEAERRAPALRDVLVEQLSENPCHCDRSPPDDRPQQRARRAA